MAVQHAETLHIASVSQTYLSKRLLSWFWNWYQYNLLFSPGERPTEAYSFLIWLCFRYFIRFFILSNICLSSPFWPRGTLMVRDFWLNALKLECFKVSPCERTPVRAANSELLLLVWADRSFFPSCLVWSGSLHPSPHFPVLHPWQ